MNLDNHKNFMSVMVTGHDTWKKRKEGKKKANSRFSSGTSKIHFIVQNGLRQE